LGSAWNSFYEKFNAMLPFILFSLEGPGGKVSHIRSRIFSDAESAELAEEDAQR